jgi:hypothetical protein
LNFRAKVSRQFFQLKTSKKMEKNALQFLLDAYGSDEENEDTIEEKKEEHSLITTNLDDALNLISHQPFSPALPKNSKLYVKPFAPDESLAIDSPKKSLPLFGEKEVTEKIDVKKNQEIWRKLPLPKAADEKAKGRLFEPKLQQRLLELYHGYKDRKLFRSKYVKNLRTTIKVCLIHCRQLISKGHRKLFIPVQ